jgi:hypothetical protein
MEDIMAWGRYSHNSGFCSNQGISGRHPEKGKSYIHKKSMVAHLWANQSQDMARNSKGSIYFKGKVIYSYGSHWPLAIITDRKVAMSDGAARESGNGGEKTIVLRNTDDGGHTTNDQAWSVRSALDGHPQYEVVFCTTQQAIWWNNGEHDKALAGIIGNKLDELKANQERLMNTRLGQYNAMEGCEYALDDTDLKQLADTLGVPVPDYDLAAMRAAIAETARKYREGEPKREKARLRREKRACLETLKKWKEQHTSTRYIRYRSRLDNWRIEEAIITAAANYPDEVWRPYFDDLRMILAAKEVDKTFEVLHPNHRRVKYELEQHIYMMKRGNGSITINEWLKGAKGYLTRYSSADYSTTLMRKKDGRLETTQGVEVPWQHAVECFKIAINCYDLYKEYVPTREIKIGHFTLDSISPDGTLHAGCHHLQFKDMLALACQEEPELASKVTARYPVPAVI